MITNEAELEVVRKQLDHAEAALDSLRKDVKPKNEATYNVMAESYIEMILTLRADVDAYVGIDRAFTSRSAALINEREPPQAVPTHDAE